MRIGRVISLAMIVFLVVLVNAPYLHGRWVDHRLDADGVDVTMAVTFDRERGGRSYLELAYPASIQVQPRTVVVEVSGATRETAVADGEVAARVLPDEPRRIEVAGQVRSRVPLLFTLFADAAILAAIVLFLRFRVAMRPELVLRATRDLERCEPGSVLDRIVGNEYVVAGALHEVDGDEVVLDLGDRRVRVLLDGHRNPALEQEPVRATGVMIA